MSYKICRIEALTYLKVVNGLLLELVMPHVQRGIH